MSTETPYPYSLDELAYFFNLSKTQLQGVANYLAHYRRYIAALLSADTREAAVNLAQASDIEQELGLTPADLDCIVARYFGL